MSAVSVSAPARPLWMTSDRVCGPSGLPVSRRVRRRAGAARSRGDSPVRRDPREVIWPTNTTLEPYMFGLFESSQDVPGEAGRPSGRDSTIIPQKIQIPGASFTFFRQEGGRGTCLGTCTWPVPYWHLIVLEEGRCVTGTVNGGPPVHRHSFLSRLHRYPVSFRLDLRGGTVHGTVKYGPRGRGLGTRFS